MNVIISKDFIYKILFGICIIVPTFNNYELTFFTWGLVTLLTLKRHYSYTLVKYIFTLLPIIIIAGISSFFYYHKAYNYLRDITYLIKPVLGMLIGYQLCKNVDNIKPFRIIVITGLFLAIIHLITVFVLVTFFSIRNMHELRFRGGYFSDFEIYALIILFFSSKFHLEFTKKQKFALLIIIGFSSLLYLARTNFIQFGCLTVAMLGYLRPTKKAMKVIFSLLVVLLLSYSAIYYSNPRRSATGLEAFLYKIKIAPTEPFKTRINEEDWKDFNDNYRSFENIITVKQVANAGTGAVLFGKGLGAQIDLGRIIWTNDEEYIRYIPTLHNSYMTIYLKSGLLGVLLMIAFIYLLLRQRKSNDEVINSINLLLIGTGVYLILSNWVFMGLYFKVDNKSIIIGYLLCYKEVLQKQKRTLIQKEC